MPALDVELPAEASSASAARSALRRLLSDDTSAERQGQHDRQQAVDRVLLLTSEIVTNAILHARTPLRLTAMADSDQVLVQVFDTVRTPPRRRSYQPDAGTGRGMHLVDALADRWGVEETAAGKCVWFAIAFAVGERAISLG